MDSTFSAKSPGRTLEGALCVPSVQETRAAAGHHRTASWTRELRSELSGRSSLVSTNNVTDDDDIIVLDWRLVWERIAMFGQSITAEGSARGLPSLVLVVQDEPFERALTARHLRKAGLDVIEAASEDQARRVLDAIYVDIVFADLETPGQANPFSLLRLLYEHHPGARTILTSGAETDMAAAEGYGIFSVSPIDWLISIPPFRGSWPPMSPSARLTGLYGPIRGLAAAGKLCNSGALLIAPTMYSMKSPSKGWSSCRAACRARGSAKSGRPRGCDSGSPRRSECVRSCA